jgi:thiol-disulfide isomerase/thioredoxin
MSKLMKYIVPALLIGVLVVFIVGFTASKSDKPLPEAELVDSNNKPVSLSAFKGKVVFINNWASWCPPCIAEMPSIHKLKNKLRSEDIIFVMVSFDENHDKAIAFMKKKGYDFEIYYPGNKYPYATESIPATFILDKSGKVVMEHTGMRDYADEKMVKDIQLILDR